jgi:hypothetical protein
VLVDAETPQSYFVTTQIGVLMSFLAGLITGSLIGVVVTLLTLMIISGVKGPESTSEGQVPNRKVFLAALVLLAVCGVCYTLDLEKSACTFTLGFVDRETWGGQEGNRSRRYCRGAICLVLTTVGSIAVEGNQWLKRWITTSDPDR